MVRTYQNRKHRTGRPYRRARAAMFAIYGDVCIHCGHPGSTDADHLIPLAIDPYQPIDPHGMRPSHGSGGCPTCNKKCNQSRGKRPLQKFNSRIEW